MRTLLPIDLITEEFKEEPLKRFQIKRSLVRFGKKNRSTMGERLKNFPIQLFQLHVFSICFSRAVLAHGACLEFHHFHLSFLARHAPPRPRGEAIFTGEDHEPKRGEEN